MASPASPIEQIEAQRKLTELSLKTDLTDLDASLGKLFNVTAPEIREITTPAELKSMIQGVQQGTADNNQLAKFIGIADQLLRKL